MSGRAVHHECLAKFAEIVLPRQHVREVNFNFGLFTAGLANLAEG